MASVHAEEKRQFVQGETSCSGYKRIALASFGVLAVMVTQSLLTAGIAVAMMRSGNLGGVHVDKAGVLESASGKPVATAGAVQLYDGSDFAALTPKELKSLETIEVKGREGAWSSYRIASMHRLPDQSIHFIANDGTKLVIGSNGTMVLERGSREGSGRHLGTVVGNPGTGKFFFTGRLMATIVGNPGSGKTKATIVGNPGSGKTKATIVGNPGSGP